MNGNSDGKVVIGEITYGPSKNPRTGILSVERKGDVLTFVIDDDRSYTINLTRGDWVFSEAKIDGNTDRSIGIQQDFANGDDAILGSPFNTNRIFKGRDGHWYAEGEFMYNGKDGMQSVHAIVQLKEDFNLDSAIQKHLDAVNA